MTPFVAPEWCGRKIVLEFQQETDGTLKLGSCKEGLTDYLLKGGHGIGTQEVAHTPGTGNSLLLPLG